MKIKDWCKKGITSFLPLIFLMIKSLTQNDLLISLLDFNGTYNPPTIALFRK
jgi:hypothetical protein